VFEYLGDELRFIRRGTSFRDRLALARIVGHMHLRTGRARRLTRLLPVRRVPEHHLSLDSGEITLRVRSSDGVLLQIMGAGVLDVRFDLLGEVESVLDLGAHAGIAAVHLSRRLPGARFVSVEPVADSFRLLEENLRRNVPGALALRVAAVADPGPRWIRDADNPAMSTVAREASVGGDQVEGLTVSDILDRAGLASVDLVKVDIEGGEAELFEAADAWALRVKAVLAEIHEPLEVGGAARTLERHGFSRLPLPAERRFERTLFMKRGAPTI
jgi:FkbM family methyltransferase